MPAENTELIRGVEKTSSPAPTVRQGLSVPMLVLIIAGLVVSTVVFLGAIIYFSTVSNSPCYENCKTAFCSHSGSYECNNLCWARCWRGGDAIDNDAAMPFVDELFQACRKGDTNLIQALLLNERVISNATYYDSTCLLNAAEKCRVKTVQTLLTDDFRANISRQDKDGRTSLHLAARSGCQEIARLLVNTGKANLEIKDNDGRTALMEAILVGSYDMVDFLVLKGANVSAKDKELSTSLHLSIATNKKFDIIRLLVENGKANLNAKDEAGETALMKAAMSDRFDVVEYLIPRGVKVDEKDEFGKTALHYAAKSAAVGVVKALVEDGHSKLDVKDNYGRTALMDAAVNGRRDVVEYLLKMGADAELKDQKGKTALMLSKQPFVKQLLSFEAGNALPL